MYKRQGVLWADIEAMRGNKSFMLSPVILNKNGIKVWKQPAFTLDGVNYVPAMTETFVSDGPAEAVGVVSGYVMFPLGKSCLLYTSVWIMLSGNYNYRRFIPLLLYPTDAPKG